MVVLIANRARVIQEAFLIVKGMGIYHRNEIDYMVDGEQREHAIQINVDRRRCTRVKTLSPNNYTGDEGT